MASESTPVQSVKAEAGMPVRPGGSCWAPLRIWRKAWVTPSE